VLARFGTQGIWWAFPVGEALSALAAWWLWRRPVSYASRPGPVGDRESPSG
jgi:Na+-driven multidrug efflux pump